MKLPTYKKYLLPSLSFSLLVIALTVVKITHAQLSQESITITPPTIKATINPGDKKEGILGLINDSNGDLSFVVNVYDFVVTDKYGTPQILPYGTIANNKYSAANWVAAAPSGFTVKAHSRFNLNYYIQIPKDAGAGGHYAAIVYQPVSAGAQAGSGAKVSTQIATLIYLSVNGVINEYAKATEFTDSAFQEYGPIIVTTEIKNFGDIHINPQGSVSLKDIFGRTVSSAQLDNRNIFPGNIALDYKSTLGSHLMFGKYTATLLASYGANNNLPLTASATIWVLPWRMLLITIFVIILITLFILVRRKKKSKETTVSTPSAPVEEKNRV